MNMLNTSIIIGDLEIKNRLVMPPMATSKANENGEVTEQICDYYNEKSAGGYIGLIITEHSYVAKEGQAGKGQMSIAKDSDVEGLKRLTDIIHNNGSKVFAQISHAGGAANPQTTGFSVALSASAVKVARFPTIPEEMTLQDIKKVINDFTAAAIRAKNAGFDGVEIHSAHGYLLNQFYSPLTNKRTDEYGSSNMNNRLRLHLEIIKSVRKVVGKEYPIALRLGACDYMDGGSTIEDGVEAAKILAEAKIDLLDISGGFCGYVRPQANNQGYFQELTIAIKKVVNIPVILTGGITDSIAAEELLQDNKADMIGVGRAILKDSSWAKEAITSSMNI